MNLIVLAAGPSDLFQNTIQKYPKPLIEINGRTIIDRVVENLTHLYTHCDNIIFIIKKSDNQKFHLKNVINLLVPQSLVVEVSGETAGAACTSLLAIEHLDDDKPLVITNGDQIIDTNYLNILDAFKDSKADAGAVVFNSVHPRWSYVKVNNDGDVVESAEKNPISNTATAGFYLYKKASIFSKFAKQMIMKDASVDGNFYICPVFNEMILSQKIIKTFSIESQQYHSFMSPEMLINYKEFLNEK
ncbi:glycosyltransferase family 2 protein [Candidatus Thioglobus sp.]|nr:glycosyltransferase family 2 protein [Candidatus Thioglobus sp.]